MRVLRPDSAFDGMIQTIFPPHVRAMPLPRREANLDRKIQMAHNEEDREDDYVGVEDEMSPRKGAAPKRGTPSKRGRGGKANATSHAVSTTPLSPTTVVPVSPPVTPVQVPGLVEKQNVSAPAVPAPQTQPKASSIALPVEKASKSGPKRGRAKRNPDADVRRIRFPSLPFLC